jgi:2'-5' RNA ligase
MGTRCFVSIDLDGLAEAVAAVQDRFEGIPGLKFTDPTQAHVTLRFLGDVSDHRLDEVREALDAAVAATDVEPFTAAFAGLGVFPTLDYISVVWLGVDAGSAEMTRLQAAIEPRLVGLGFEADDHEFTPHVTLARMEHAGGKERVQEIVREQEPAAGELEVAEVRLTASELEADGPRYSTVERFAL